MHGHTGHFVKPHVAAHCGGPEHTRATCGGDMYVMYANALSVAGTSHSLSHTWATNCSVLAKAWKQWFPTGINIPATMRGHMWLNKVASVLMFKCMGRAFASPLFLSAKCDWQHPDIFYGVLGGVMVNAVNLYHLHKDFPQQKCVILRSLSKSIA